MPIDIGDDHHIESGNQRSNVIPDDTSLLRTNVDLHSGLTLDPGFLSIIHQSFEDKKIMTLLAQITTIAQSHIDALDHFVYHNSGHIKNMCKKSLELAEAIGLTMKDKMILYIAGLFHDTGLVRGSKGHEEVSASLAVSVLTSSPLLGILRHYDISVNDIAKTILSTRYTFQDNMIIQSPTNKREKAFCD